MNGLISFWDFQEAAGEPRVAQGAEKYALREMAGPVQRVDGGIFGSCAAQIQDGQWLAIPRAQCPKLNLRGPKAQVSVVAWIKRQTTSYDHCEAIAGMWNESRKKRQYCLFLNLHIWQSHDQVAGHVSHVGGPTPGHPWCMDASIGQTPVPRDRWCCVGFTYDSQQACSYFNGQCDPRPQRNPYPYPHGLFDGGDDGADFTVGAVDRSDEMGNFFAGIIGGLAVFDRALTQQEMARLAAWPKTP